LPSQEGIKYSARSCRERERERERETEREAERERETQKHRYATGREGRRERESERETERNTKHRNTGIKHTKRYKQTHTHTTHSHIQCLWEGGRLIGGIHSLRFLILTFL
jgi:hypothetical protein